MRMKVDNRPSPHGSDGTHHTNLVTQVEDKALVSYAGQVVMEAECAASTERIISGAWNQAAVERWRLKTLAAIENEREVGLSG
jgi:hypothetical protein